MKTSALFLLFIYLHFSCVTSLSSKFMKITTKQSWSGWLPVHGQLSHEPAVVNCFPRRIDLYCRGLDGNLWIKTNNNQNHYNNEWINQNFPISDQPVADCSGDNTINLFVKGSDGSLLLNRLVNDAWTGWNNFGLSGYQFIPNTVSTQAGNLNLFIVGSDGNLYQRIFENGNWGQWTTIGSGGFQSAPFAVVTTPGTIELFIKGSDGNLWVKRSTNGTWGDWANLSLSFQFNPFAIYWNNRLDVFVSASDGSLYQRTFENGYWGNWNNLGTTSSGAINATPSATSLNSNQLYVFVRGGSNGFARAFSNGYWMEWEPLGGHIISRLIPIKNGLNYIDLFARGGNQAVWVNNYK